MLIRALLLAALVSGCVHRIELITSPVGASVSMGNKRLPSAPTVLKIRPFQKRDVTVQIAGYRPFRLRLRADAGTSGFLGELVTLRWFRMLGLRTHSSYEVRLIPEHGGAGTWTPEDVP